MSLKTAFSINTHHLKNLVATDKDLLPYLEKGVSFATRTCSEVSYPAIYESYIKRTSAYLLSLHSIQNDARRFLFDSEWSSLSKMILCYDLLTHYTQDGKGNIKSSGLTPHSPLRSLFTIDEIKDFMIYKGFLDNDEKLHNVTSPRKSRILYYADRLTTSQHELNLISKLSALPNNSRELLDAVLDCFDHIHAHNDIPFISLEMTIRNHIAHFLDLPAADDKIAFFGHHIHAQENAPR